MSETVFRRRAAIRCFLVCLVGIVANSTSAQHPNILYIVADDMSADAMSFLALQESLGNGENQRNSVSTPTLDALARQGTTFINAYNQGGWSGAVCLTSRTAIMTGRPMWNAPGSGQPNSTVAVADTMPRLFASAGYDTARFGKAGNDYGPATNAFSTHLENDSRDAQASKWFADQGVRYLQNKVEANDADPYLLYLGISHPHDPRNAPRSFLNRHGAKNGDPDPGAPLDEYDPLPSAYLDAHPFDNGHLSVRDENLVDGVGQRRDERTIRNEIGKNHAVIEYMDGQIRRVIDQALQYEGLSPVENTVADLQNTLIVFTADHGMSVGRHGLVGKQNIYEHTLRVPYLIAGAVDGVPIPVGVNEKNIYLHDSLPTLLELSGLPIGDSVQTESFAAALSPDSATRGLFAGHEVVYGAYSPSPNNHVQRSIKVQEGDDVWKTIHYPHVNRTQLFNLAVDPDETDDLSHDPQYAAVMSRMAMTMHEQQDQWNDPARGRLGRIGVNLAYGRSATQSSGGSAELALNGAGAVVSGLPSGIGGGNSLIRTGPAQTIVEDNPWWMVDLGTSQAIGEIALHSAISSDATLHLSDIRVEILDDSMGAVYASDLLALDDGGDWLAVDLNSSPQVGQFIRVTREASDTVLALDEVQVFAPGWVPPPPPPEPGDVSIRWGAPQETVGLEDLALAKAGEVVVGYSGGNRDLVVDGVRFAVNDLPSGAFRGSLVGKSSGDAQYDALLDSFTYGGGTEVAVELAGLTVGETYGVQVWYTDLREQVDGRTMRFSSAAGNFVDVIGNASGADPADFLGQYAIGVFEATDETALVEMQTNGFANVHYNALLAFALPSADFSVDGDVDADDLSIWETNFGLAAGAARDDGDADADFDVDGADFLRWQRQFTGNFAAASPQNAAISEPASLASMVVVTAVNWLWRRGRSIAVNRAS